VQLPLTVPTIRDRVVQTAALLVLEPIFEADLQPEQYAYRENRSALEAVQEVHRLLRQGYREAIDADLSGYFDSIPHPELMLCVARRVSDKAMLHLIKQWLVAPVEETDVLGRVQRTTRNKDTKRGSPQGAPISPLSEDTELTLLRASGTCELLLSTIRGTIMQKMREMTM
jgi:retron-type reverse transcriptase